MKNIASLGEFGLIEKITSRLKPGKGIRVGPGDDCAVVRHGNKTLLLTTDLLIEGLHFRRDWATAREIGFKAMRVNLSDIGAMGGRPLYALVSVGLPRSLALSFATDLFRGLKEAGEEAGCSIVGGDTNASDRLLLNVAMVGEAPAGKYVTRSGARPGDFLYVTGTLGGAALGLAVLQRKRKRAGFEKDVRSHLLPPLRVSVGQFLGRNRGVRAMIDLSDGLAGDLPHILERSGVGAVVDLDRLPLSAGFASRAKALAKDPLTLALNGGEDYELLFVASPGTKVPSKIHGVAVTKIGKITRRHGLSLTGLGNDKKLILKGFQHF